MTTCVYAQLSGSTLSSSSMASNSATASAWHLPLPLELVLSRTCVAPLLLLQLVRYRAVLN